MWIGRNCCIGEGALLACNWKKNMKKIAFIVQMPREVSPGQRFRFELWEPVLEKHNIGISTYPFFDLNTYRKLYLPGYFFTKFFGVVKGFIKRFGILFKLKNYDYIFLQREFAPVGPPIFEWIAAKVLGCKIIYDFDDAIWIASTSKENKFASWLKACWKVKYICKWSYKVVGGNEFLCEYARPFNKQVIKIPTCVDTVHHHNRLKDQETEKVVIGWTGSHSTMKYLNELIPVFEALQQKYPIELVVISNRSPEFSLTELRNVSWQEKTEIEDLLQINIGLMPLDPDPWCEGKCGFKLIQYLSLGIPAVASPVGVNKIIIEEGVNGFLCTTHEEWVKALSVLIENKEMRTGMGKKGRAKIEKEYSVVSQAEKFIELFK
jgi:glycosyltransferase involved in cell wall biosynthesis